MADTKTAKVTFGIKGHERPDEIKIPTTDPQPWDLHTDLKIIGKRVPRIDGVAKVTGRAKYTYDINLPGMLYGKILRSPHAAARIKSMDLSKAKALPGVRVVLAYEEMPNKNKEQRVFFAGQEVAAVAAVSRYVAEDAIKLIEVEYEPLPFVVSEDKARESDAPIVLPVPTQEKTSEGDLPQRAGQRKVVGNVVSPTIFKQGDIEKGFAEADAIIEATYRTQVQTHSALETHGLVCQWEADDKLKAWASTQGTFSVLNELKDYFKLPANNVRVITEYMGGGFGAKFGAGVHGVVCAMLARKANAPVKLMLDRREEHLAVGNRPSSVQKIRIGAKKDGTLTAMHLVAYGTGGIAGGAGCSGPMKNVYTCTNIQTEESDVYTNAGPSAAFRAPGHPQGTFALDSALDLMAEKLGMDPLEFRRKNLTNTVRLEEYRVGAERIDWQRRNKRAGVATGTKRRGIGMASSVWYNFAGPPSTVIVEIHNDGQVDVKNGAQDIGTGMRTVIAQIAAEELGLRVEDITVHYGDTQWPIGPGSGGSTTTTALGPAVRTAVYAAKLKIFEVAAPILKAKPEDLAVGNRKVFVKDNPARSIDWAQAARRIEGDKISVTGDRAPNYHQAFGPDQNKKFDLTQRNNAGAQFVEVEVDTETGQVTVIKVIAVNDAGLPMNRLTMESQINGGVIQGISYALLENRLLDKNTGVMVNPNLEQYKVPGSKDMPIIEAHMIDNSSVTNNISSMGIGEPATVPTAAAINNAIYNAIGVQIRELPITPDKVLAALNQEKKEGAMNRFEYVNVTSFNDAAALIGADEVKLKAGGVDLFDQMKERLITPSRLVNISRVPNANYITVGKDDVRIGALATLAQIAAHPEIHRSYKALAEAAGHAATPQIRNMATIGGNLCQRPRCWYFRGSDFHCLRKGGDHCFAQTGENRYHAIFDNVLCAIVHPSSTAPALMAFDARVKILTGSKTREVALKDFFILPDKDVHHENILQPNELITEIIIPKTKANTRSVYLKQAEMESHDSPTADVSVALTMSGGVCKEARIILGAASPAPRRAAEAEAIVTGKAITEEVARSAAKAALASASPMTDNAYKVLIFDTLIRRALLQAAA